MVTLVNPDSITVSEYFHDFCCFTESESHSVVKELAEVVIQRNVSTFIAELLVTGVRIVEKSHL